MGTDARTGCAHSWYRCECSPNTCHLERVDRVERSPEEYAGGMSLGGASSAVGTVAITDAVVETARDPPDLHSPIGREILAIPLLDVEGCQSPRHVGQRAVDPELRR